MIGRLLPPILVGCAVAAFAEAAKLLGLLPISIAAPSDLLAALRTDADLLWFHASATGLAALAGFGLATAAALLMAAAAAWLRALEPVLYNVAVVVHTLPLLVLAPILVIWLGLGIEVRIVIAGLSAFFPILVAALRGLRAADPRTLELLHVLAASRWQRLRHAVLPAGLRTLFGGLKIGAAGAVLGAVIAEWTGAERGLGLMMSYALFSFQVPRVWLGMLAAAAIAVAAFGAVRLVERRALAWDRQPPVGPS